jgi:hypothetical protein
MPLHSDSETASGDGNEAWPMVAATARAGEPTRIIGDVGVRTISETDCGDGLPERVGDGPHDGYRMSCSINQGLEL